MKTLSEICKLVPGLLELHQGDPETLVTEISSQEAPSPQSLVFLSKESFLENILKSQASGIVIPSEFAAKVPPHLKINILTSKNPRYSLALLLQKLAPNRLEKQYDSEIHPTAVIHPTSKVAKNVVVGPHAFIGANTSIGEGSTVGASAVIQSDCVLGKNCRIHELSYIGANSSLGDFCEVFPHAAVGTEGFGYAQDGQGAHSPIPHQGGVILEDHVHIGAGSKIDRGTFGNTVIKKHTKIDNLCHLAHNCTIGQSSLVTAGFMSAGSTKIGDYFACGGRTTVTGHIEIADQVQVAGLSGVQKSITQPGKYQGFPISPHNEGIKNMLAYSKLGKMRADLKKVLKKLEMSETK